MCDIIFSWLCVPQILAPFAAVRFIGFLTEFDLLPVIQLYLFISAFGRKSIVPCIKSLVTSASTVHLFFHRHQTILPNQHFRSIRPVVRTVLTVLIYVIWGTPAIVWGFGTSSNNSITLQEYTKVVHC